MEAAHDVEYCLFTIGAVFFSVCGNNPADIVFLLDSSSSILEKDFPKQLRFVEGVVDLFNVSEDAIRIGIVSFSNWAFVDFHLNAHKTELEVRHAIR